MTSRPLPAPPKKLGSTTQPDRHAPVKPRPRILPFRKADPAVMLQPTKAGGIGAPRAGRSGLYLFGFVAAAVAIREGLVMVSSRKHSLSRASLNKPSSRTIAATVRRSSSARRAMREQVS
jgi:hypothetical protein